MGDSSEHGDKESRPPLATDLVEKYTGQEGNIVWPAEETERKELARALLGRQWVGSLDYWLDHGVDLVQHAAPSKPFSRENEFTKEDRYFREHFRWLSADEKRAVVRLLETVAQGLMFSMLVDLDQGEHGQLTISLQPPGPAAVKPVVISPALDRELPDDMTDWVLSFSKRGADLVAPMKSAGFWHLGRRPAYRETP